MANFITCSITSTNNLIINNSSASMLATVNGTTINGYEFTLPIYSPSGFVSRPMPNAMAMAELTPHAQTGIITGFTNAMPETSNVKNLAQGESAITETSAFNFNMQAKLDGLKSVFTNSSNANITTNFTISENVVSILQDIIAEIIALESAYNNFINNVYNTHFHIAPSGGGNTDQPHPTGSAYNSTANFNNANTFINQSPSPMYININGKIL